jgi:DNA polymerase-3 subunit delta
MKINADAFQRSLQKPLQPLYWISSDEPLQLSECRMALCEVAKTQGYLERQRFDSQNIDLVALRSALYSSSLFSAKNLVEISLSSSKLSEGLASFLQTYCQKPSPNAVLLLFSAKLDSSMTQTKLFKEFEAAGVVVQCWPMSPEQLPQWLSARLAKHQLKTSLQALKVFAELTEGNLLYADQAVEKLALIYAGHQAPLTPEEILEAVLPQASFDVFQLNEAFLQGDTARCLRISRSLQATDAEIMLVFGALLKDVRILIRMAAIGERNFAEACQKLGIWEKRKPLYRMALQRGCTNPSMLKAMASIDRMVKNNTLGDPWAALERFIIRYTSRV